MPWTLAKVLPQTFSLTFVEGLLEDLLDDLRTAGVLLEPWDDVADSVRHDILAVVYAPSSGVPAQAFLRPVDVELAIVVCVTCRGTWRRMRAMGTSFKANTRSATGAWH